MRISSYWDPFSFTTMSHFGPIPSLVSHVALGQTNCASLNEVVGLFVIGRRHQATDRLH